MTKPEHIAMIAVREQDFYKTLELLEVAIELNVSGAEALYDSLLATAALIIIRDKVTPDQGKPLCH